MYVQAVQRQETKEVRRFLGGQTGLDKHDIWGGFSVLSFQFSGLSEAGVVSECGWTKFRFATV